MFVMLFAAFFFAVLGLFINAWVSLALAVAVVFYILTIFWTLKLSNAPKPVWNAVAAMPAFVLRQVKGLLKMGNPNKNFKHTEHKVNVTIEEVLK